MSTPGSSLQRPQAKKKKGVALQSRHIDIAKGNLAREQCLVNDIEKAVVTEQSQQVHAGSQLSHTVDEEALEEVRTYADFQKNLAEYLTADITRERLSGPESDSHLLAFLGREKYCSQPPINTPTAETSMARRAAYPAGALHCGPGREEGKIIGDFDYDTTACESTGENGT